MSGNLVPGTMVRGMGTSELSNFHPSHPAWGAELIWTGLAVELPRTDTGG